MFDFHLHFVRVVKCYLCGHVITDRDSYRKTDKGSAHSNCLLKQSRANKSRKAE